MNPVYEDIVNLPESERAGFLLNCTESQWFDRKSIDVGPKDVVKLVIAFANTEGGLIIVGVNREKGVYGVSRDAKKDGEIRKAIYECVNPSVSYHCRINLIPVIDNDGKEDSVIAISVDASDTVHEDAGGKCYVRVGTSTKELRHDERQELMYSRGVRQYDGELIGDSDLDDIDPELLHEYCQKIGYSGTDDLSVLRARYLVSDKGEQTNACHLLFSRHPQDIFPQSSIRITKFLSDERGTGSGLNVDQGNDYRFDGNIPTLIRCAIKTMDELVPQRKALNADGVFAARYVIPREAWMEGIVNALIHRSYSIYGDYVHVEIYPSRIEITSPGLFPGRVRLIDPTKISRFARNPRIARVCTEFGFGQELGEGIKRIFKEMKQYGYIDPIYSQGTNNVTLKLEAIARLAPEVAATLPKGAEAIINVIKMSGQRGAGTGEIALTLGIARPTALTRLRELESLGLVVDHRNGETDPRAYWTIASDSLR